MKLLKKKEVTESVEGTQETVPAVSKKKLSKKQKKWIRLGIIAVVIIGAAAGLKMMQTKAAGKPMPMQTIAVTKGEVEQTVSTSGFVESEISKTYFSPVDATISSCSIKQGDSVETGQMLVEFDTADFELKMKQASLKADVSDMTVKKSVNESQESEIEYVQSSNNVEFYKMLIVAQRQKVQDLKNQIADIRRARMCELYGDQYRLNKEMNDYQGKLRSVSANSADYENYNKKLTEINNSLSLTSRELSEASNMPLTEEENRLVQEQYLLTDMEGYMSNDKSIKATAEEKILNAYELGELKLNNKIEKLSATEVRDRLEKAKGGVVSEFDGIVTSVDVLDGATTTLGTKLMTIESSNDLKVVVSLSKYDLEQVKLNQQVDITITGNEYKGTVTKINRMAEKNDSGTPMVSAEIHIDNPDDNIYLGIEAKVTIHINQATDVVLAPVETINVDKEGSFCYVVENETIVKRRVTTGISSDTFIEIKEGLKENDQLIGTVTMDIQEGMKVTPISANAAGQEQ